MEIIVPAAGLSRRFPDTKPKYLLYGYNGVMMLERALAPYLTMADANITVGILEEHDKKYSAREFITNELGSRVNVIVLPTVTRGPADTVMQIIRAANINLRSPLLIRDCDSYFNHELDTGNYVCTAQIKHGANIESIRNKSFVVTNNVGIIQHIIEKEVVSDQFCVGGYGFASTELYVECFRNIQANSSTEIYVSHIIEYAITTGNVFLNKNVTDHVDVGTLDEWIKYNNKPTLFCDVDGTVIVAQGRWGSNNYSTPVVPLQNNIAVLKEYQKNGSQIIFTTSRPESARAITIQVLEDLGFKNPQLIIGLNNSGRILINDYNASNPYPTATAVNIKRNSDNLGDYLDKPLVEAEC